MVNAKSIRNQSSTIFENHVFLLFQDGYAESLTDR